MRTLKINKSVLQKLVIIGILVVIVVALSLLSKQFLTAANFYNVAVQVALVIIVGCPVTLLMISGNLDLSVGGTIAVTGILFAKFATWGIPLWICALMACLIGALVGYINGALVVNLKITSVIATLGLMYVTRGLAYIFSDGKNINAGLPNNFDKFGRMFIGPVPLSLIIFIIVVAIFYFVESKTVFGKYSFAIGGNRTAAELSGINIGKMTLLLFVIVGFLAGFSGVLLGSRLGVGQPNVGVGFEFDIIVAVILGGTSLAGGKGSILGMVIGAFIVGFLANGLNLMGIASFWQSVIKGIVLVGAVVLDRLIKEKIR
jgi:ribose/xylose/arabinose/galactoside ABC-type transport system permease subunit